MERKEAIEVIKKNWPDSSFTMLREALETLIPELTESEDERIRNEIIAFIEQSIHRGGGTPIPEEQEAKWLAWLEKQGEQKLYVNDNAKEMFIKALECVEERNNKGYKLTDCDKNSWWEDFKAYTSCTIEQKPIAWSEEDEQYLLVCKNALAKYQVSDKWDAIIISRWLEDKLKSLRPQNTWKPSKEQIIALRWVLNNVPYNKHKEEISGLLDQIKGL